MDCGTRLLLQHATARLDSDVYFTLYTVSSIHKKNILNAIAFIHLKSALFEHYGSLTVFVKLTDQIWQHFDGLVAHKGHLYFSPLRD